MRTYTTDIKTACEQIEACYGPASLWDFMRDDKLVNCQRTYTVHEDRSVVITEDDFAVVEYDDELGYVNEFTCSNIMDAMYEMKRLLQDNPDGDISVFKLQQGWKDISHSYAEDSIIETPCGAPCNPHYYGCIIAEFWHGSGDEKNDLTVSCCFSYGDMRTIKSWLSADSDEHVQFTGFYGTLEAFLEAEDDWMDWLADGLLDDWCEDAEEAQR